MSKLLFSKFMSAPLDGVLDSPARQMIRQFSPNELLFGEMRHVACVAHEKEQQSLRHDPIEQPLAFQVSANSTLFVELAVEKIVEHNFVMLNLNAGCPAKNVIKSGSGCALMATPDVLQEILRTMHKKLAGKIPLSLKIRAGYKEKNGLEIAKMAQDCGVQELIIHPRTQPEGFSGPLDFEMVRQIKKALSIPVIFSGDISSYADAQATHEKTGVDGFMIGRALWGAPWKLAEIACLAKGKPFSFSQQEIIRVAIKHLDLTIKFYGPGGINPFKAHLARYLRGFINATDLRKKFLVIQDHEEMSQKLALLL